MVEFNVTDTEIIEPLRFPEVLISCFLAVLLFFEAESAWATWLAINIGGLR